MHKARPRAVRAGAEWYGRYVRAGIEQNVGGDDGEPMVFLTKGAGLLDEDGDVIIRVTMVIAASPRTEQHDALDPVAVQLVNRGSEAPEHRVIDGAQRKATLVHPLSTARAP